MEPPQAARTLPFGLLPWGLLGAAASVAAALSLAGFLDGVFPALFFAPPFRAQYAVCLGLAAAVFAVGRRPRSAVACALFAALNAAIVAPAYLPADQPANTGPTLRFLVANTLRSNRDHARLLALLAAEQPDVIVLSEVTPALWESLAPIRGAYPHHRAEPRRDAFGIALLSRQPLVGIELGGLGPLQRPWLRARLTTAAGALQVVAAHPSPPARRELMEITTVEMAELGRELAVSEQPLVLLGDLNSTPWSSRFRELLSTTGLRDSTRGFGLQPSFPVGLLPLRIPLDHALVSSELEVLDRRLGPDIGADHLPVILDLRLPR